MMDLPERICDAHLHYGERVLLQTVSEASPLRGEFPCYRTVQFHQMDDYDARLKENGIERAVCIPFVFRELDKRRESLLVMDFAERYPGKCYPYALLDENDPGFVEEYFRRIVGVKEHIVLHETELTNIRREVFASMQAHGLTLLLHTRADRRIAYVSQIAREFPQLKIQVAHMGRATPDNVPFMLEVMEALRPWQQISFDTSTIRRPDVVAKAVELLGPERILFGSDFPFFMDACGAENIMEQQILQVLRAGLTQNQQELIFAGNFDRLITFGA